jgi:alpha-L-rhamnosidase
VAFCFKNLQEVLTANPDCIRVTLNVVPFPRSFGSWVRNPAAIWGDVSVTTPWSSWNLFGDLDSLTLQYPSAKLWLDKGVVRNSVAGLWKRGAFQYGDWLDPLSPTDVPGKVTTNSTYVADAYLVHVTELVSQMA